MKERSQPYIHDKEKKKEKKTTLQPSTSPHKKKEKRKNNLTATNTKKKKKERKRKKKCERKNSVNISKRSLEMVGFIYLFIYFQWTEMNLARETNNEARWTGKR